jgi:hypothetical protein
MLSLTQHDIAYAKWRISSDWLDLNLILFGDDGMTPAEIGKLTAHAERAKKLMVRSSEVGQKAGPVLDSYEATLSLFEANISRVSKEDAALAAMMAAMGNAGPVLDAAFQDDKVVAGPVSAKPEETAHLPAVNGKT